MDPEKPPLMTGSSHPCRAIITPPTSEKTSSPEASFSAQKVDRASLTHAKLLPAAQMNRAKADYPARSVQLADPTLPAKLEALACRWQGSPSMHDLLLGRNPEQNFQPGVREISIGFNSARSREAKETFLPTVNWGSDKSLPSSLSRGGETFTDPLPRQSADGGPLSLYEIHHLCQGASPGELSPTNVPERHVHDVDVYFVSESGKTRLPIRGAGVFGEKSNAALARPATPLPRFQGSPLTEFRIKPESSVHLGPRWSSALGRGATFCENVSICKPQDTGCASFTLTEMADFRFPAGSEASPSLRAIVRYAAWSYSPTQRFQRVSLDFAAASELCWLPKLIRKISPFLQPIQDLSCASIRSSSKAASQLGPYSSIFDGPYYHCESDLDTSPSEENLALPGGWSQNLYHGDMIMRPMTSRFRRNGTSHKASALTWHGETDPDVIVKRDFQFSICNIS
ncbi:uncharacterized protein CLUP02_09885 [Colletotrichum lupini]|uniref:Uncharacterized protein n=1 Tax=Colletotrichum lupini TaxID=145971 RepID=A0A9Q8SVT7_9PEZI|nr:uncharacterized protein CLUP02_09885 [Colletotrichum lupini]UQC84388.1 hypothetical protein CLUP02_09885 [Colletotrichum lupini]